MSTSYATVAELKAQINMTGTSDDAVLQAIIDAASQSIDNFCQRADGFVADAKASTRTYPGSGGPVQ